MIGNFEDYDAARHNGSNVDGGGELHGGGYTPAQLARISGVSVRTLHHYDQIGLLVPARRENGYRVYRPADVERLQQILIFRGLGIELANIATLLDADGRDQASAMRAHLSALHRRRHELDQLILTVENTIDRLEGHRDMKNQNKLGRQQNDRQKFEALKQQAVDENERAYGQEVRARYGDKTVNAANEKLLQMDQQEWDDVNELGEEILKQLSRAMEQGDPADAAARRLAQMHATWLRAFWPDGIYSAQAHRNMADMYVADERFTAYYDGPCGEGAARFLRDAVYAATDGASQPQALPNREA